MPAPARAAPPRPIAAAVRPPAQAEPSPHVSQIFVPPDPDLEELGDEVEDEAPEAAPLPLGSLAATFALVLVAAALLALVRQPASYLLPFPWQDHRQSSVQRYLRQSLFQKVDRAAKAYFLMEAHYPDRLDELIELGLLSPSDTRDPAGNSLSYQAEGVRYTIRLVGPDGAPIEGVEETEAITGDFLLDPQFIPAEAANESPLVLLD